MDNWANILDENIVKTNVNFAALFVMNYECLKDYVISQVKGFYCDDLYFENDEAIYIESEAYKQEVRTLDKQLENASLKWWINEIEIPTSADEIPEDYDRDGVCGGQAIVLSIINDIVLGNGGEKYKNILNELLKQK